MSQQIQEHKEKQLYICGRCGKLGYQYTRVRGNHKYLYTKHTNEPPIGYYRNGQLKYRECYDKSRLYEGIDDMIQAVRQKRARALKEKKKLQRLKKISDCPKCHKKGRLQDYNDRGIIKQVVIHEKIKGEFWGRKNKVQARERCWLGRKTIN